MEWGHVVGLAGAFTSCLVILAPVPIFYQIIKKKSTESYHCLPYMVALISYMLWAYFAWLEKDYSFDIYINSIGCVLEAVYIVLFLVYASSETRKLTLMMLVIINIGAFFSIIFITHLCTKGEKEVLVIGLISSGVSAVDSIAPFSIIPLVVKTKNVKWMPVTLSFFIMINGITWYIRDELLREIFYPILPNLISIFFGFLMMILYIVFKYVCKFEDGVDETDSDGGLP